MRFVLFLVCLMTPLISISAQEGAAARPDPMALIEDVPGLPRVLLIGDSISIGYTLAVRELLDGVANVHRPPTNCGPTLRGLAQLDDWLGEKLWDVIHFNFGLHDLKYIARDSDPRHAGKLVAVDEGEQMVPLKVYARNLERLTERLQETGAALVWCATTPVPVGAKGRVPGHAATYNRAAATVMGRLGVPIHDLHAFADARLADIQQPANVHFSREGSRMLAESVVRHLLPQLPMAAQIKRAVARQVPLEQLTVLPELPRLLPENLPEVTAWPALRGELCQQLAYYIYGFAAPVPPTAHFRLMREDRLALDGKATKREVRVRVGSASFDLLLHVPNKAAKPVPVFLGLNFRGNHTTTADPEVSITASWVPKGKGVENHRATALGRGSAADRWPLEAIIDRGYAVATVYHGDIAPDHAQERGGIPVALTPSLSPEHMAHQWGHLRIWAYGLSRAADYLVSDPDIHAERIAVMGHSRNGKAALVAGAFDERFAMVISNQSGCGGAALSRRRHGETVQVINRHFPHWFNGAFKAFDEREDFLPVDQHSLLAAVAPRPLLVCSATGDDWADPMGEFLAAKEASQVVAWLGGEGLESAEYPPENVLLGESVAYHVRPGRHGVGLADWRVFMDFADRQGWQE